MSEGTERTATVRRRASAAATAIAVLVPLGLLTGCTAGTDEAAPTPTPTPTCVSNEPGPADTTAFDEQPIVTAGVLCARDGGDWQRSGFIIVLNTPYFPDPSESCHQANMDAFYAAWKPSQPMDKTFDLHEPDNDWVRGVGSVAISVSSSPAVEAEAAVAALDAELDACIIDGSDQARVEHGSWRGVRGPHGHVDDIRTSWWLQHDSTWVLVQARASGDATEAEIAAFDISIGTLLDAQSELLED